MKRICKLCLLVLAGLLEPVCHVTGLPHPEGLGQLVANHFATHGLED